MSESPYLGYTFRDVVTGFKGVCIAHVCYLTGCDQLGLHPGMQADGKLGDVIYFDTSRCEAVYGPRVQLVQREGQQAGGPQAAPGRQG